MTRFMDILLLFFGFIFICLGIIGAFLPILPGPLTGWVGLLLLHFTSAVPKDWTFLGITLFVAALVWVLDYFIPAMGTKRFGGSKAGMIGTSIGLIVGLLAPIPGGIIIGPFVGALVGELLNKSEFNKALKAAFGSFLGFLASTFIKFIVALVFLGLFIVKVVEYQDVLF